MRTFVVISTKRFHHIYIFILLYIIKIKIKCMKYYAAHRIYETFQVLASFTFKKILDAGRKNIHL